MPQPRWSSKLQGRPAMARCRVDGSRTELRQSRRVALDHSEPRLEGRA